MMMFLEVLVFPEYLECLVFPEYLESLVRQLLRETPK